MTLMQPILSPSSFVALCPYIHMYVTPAIQRWLDIPDYSCIVFGHIIRAHSHASKRTCPEVNNVRWKTSIDEWSLETSFQHLYSPELCPRAGSDRPAHLLKRNDSTREKMLTFRHDRVELSPTPLIAPKQTHRRKWSSKNNEVKLHKFVTRLRGRTLQVDELSTTNYPLSALIILFGVLISCWKIVFKQMGPFNDDNVYSVLSIPQFWRGTVSVFAAWNQFLRRVQIRILK